MAHTYNVDTRRTNRYEIEEDMVGGAYGNTSLQEQAEAYSNNVSDMAQAVADFYAGEEVEWQNFDGTTLDIASYASTYISRQLVNA